MTENQVFFDVGLKQYVKIVKEEICEPGENLCNDCPYRNTKAANDCEMGRGGKYGCEVSRFDCGEKNIIRKPYDGRETAAENLMKRG